MAVAAGIDHSRFAPDASVCSPAPWMLPGTVQNDPHANEPRDFSACSDDKDFQRTVRCQLQSIERKLEGLARQYAAKEAGFCSPFLGRRFRVSTEPPRPLFDQPPRPLADQPPRPQDHTASPNTEMQPPHFEDFPNLLPSACTPRPPRQSKTAPTLEDFPNLLPSACTPRPSRQSKTAPTLEDSSQRPSKQESPTWLTDFTAEPVVRKKTRDSRAKTCGSLLSRIRVDSDETEQHWITSVEESLGITRLRNSRRNVMKEAEKRMLWRCVHSGPCQVLICMVICTNALYIGFNTNAELTAYIGRTQPGSEWAAMDAVFFSVFTFELLMRALAERCLFFYGVEWIWNFFDTALVLLSGVNLIFNCLDETGMSNLGVARMLRFVRFVRLVRLARAVRAIQSLRLFILSILSSGVSLTWCVLIVAVIVYFFASIILSGVTEYFRDPHWEELEGAKLAEFYGTVWRTMVTLFMSISGGISWREPLEPLIHVHWAYEPAFTFFIFFMFFGVLNIVVGAFVTATGEIARKDRDFLTNAELEAVKAYTEKTKEFFLEADLDHSGMLSWKELECHLKNPKVSAYFASLELDVSHAHRLFKLLDADFSGEVGIDEFLDGCMRLKGHAKSIDVNMLVYETAKISRQISVLLEAQQSQVSAALEDIRKAYPNPRSGKGGSQSSRPDCEE